MTVLTLDPSKTAADYRALSAASSQASRDSFDRCDTDGFLSQWASDLTAQRYLRAAELVEAGGVATERALFFADGTPTGARYVQTRFGGSWVYDTDAGDTVWVNPSKANTEEKRRAALLKKGYTLGRVQGAGVIRCGGTGHMLYYYPSIDRDAERTVVTTDDLTAY